MSGNHVHASEPVSGWDERAPVRLRRAELIERLWKEITETLLGLVSLKPGDRVLDVGTGHGEPALTAARAVGPEGHVVGIDLSPEMISIANRRAAAANVQTASFQVQNVEELDSAGESFDAALCRLSLMFVQDVGKALERVRLALAPGGRFAVATIGGPEKAPQWTMTIEALVRELGITAPPTPAPGEPGVFALCDPERLERHFKEAGYVNVWAEPRVQLWQFASAEEVAIWHTINPTITGLLAGQPEVRCDAAWKAVVAAARARADEDGSVRFANEIVYAVGERPR